MEYANGRDALVGRLERLNSIIKSPTAPTILDDVEAVEEEPPGRSARSKGKSGKSGTGDQSGVVDMFSRAAQKVFRRIHNAYAAILGKADPSDGHPQQEHCPDWAWFRPISHNRQAWIDTWPELQV
jgi:hypothetical protein